MTPREIETLKHKTRFVLETYSRIKDLLIHDIRNFLNFIRGKRSIDSLDRLVKIHVDIFTDLYDTWVCCMKLKFVNIFQAAAAAFDNKNLFF